MKRTWITVKRGILEPKHRFALGELIWLFIYILDLANWEEGVIMEWTDKGAAEEMDMPLATLRDQRRKLEERGYISSERKRYGLRIIVHNWTNPKEYTGKKYNVKPQSDTESDTESDKTPSDNLHSSLYQKSKVKNQKDLPDKKQSGNLFQIAHALSSVTGLDYEKNKNRIYKIAKSFNPGEEQQIIRDYGIGGIWYKNDWRGKQGQKPTLEQVVQTWNNLQIVAVGKTTGLSQFEKNKQVHDEVERMLENGKS